MRFGTVIGQMFPLSTFIAIMAITLSDLRYNYELVKLRQYTY